MQRMVLKVSSQQSVLHPLTRVALNLTLSCYHYLKTMVKSATSNKKDKKKAKKGPVEEDAAAAPEQFVAEDNVSTPQPIDAPKGPIEMTPDDLADEEWGPVGEKGKKGKKAKGKKAKGDEDDETSTPGECVV